MIKTPGATNHTSRKRWITDKFWHIVYLQREFDREGCRSYLTLPYGEENHNWKSTHLYCEHSFHWCKSKMRGSTWPEGETYHFPQLKIWLQCTVHLKHFWTQSNCRIFTYKKRNFVFPHEKCILSRPSFTSPYHTTPEFVQEVSGGFNGFRCITFH